MGKEKLTPETEECYERVPATFPSDWFDRTGPKDEDFGLRLKKEAPARAHKELKEYRDYYLAMAAKGIMVN